MFRQIPRLLFSPSTMRLFNRPSVPRQFFAHSAFNPLKIADIKQIAERRLATYGLIPPDKDTDQFQQRLKDLRVFYSTQAYPSHKLIGDDAFTLERAIKKVTAIDVGASYAGEMPTGEPWPGADFFMNLKSGDAKGLSTAERMLARNKIIASPAMIYSYGGYPHQNPVTILQKPKEAYIFTLAGLQFESPQLDYKLCMIDSYQNSELYKILAANLNESCTYLKSDKGQYINRDSITGAFTLSDCITNSTVLFDKKAYYKSVLNDFVMVFAAAERMVDGSKSIYFKVPFVGLGFFACLNRLAYIKSTLMPIYLEALVFALRNYSFNKLKVVELPVFSSLTAQLVRAFAHGRDLEINGIKILFKDSDVLNFDAASDKEYHFCAVNPGDAHSYPGNEFGASKYQPGSVESAIGNHTDIRYTQNFLLNPAVLQPDNWVGITVGKKGYDYRDVAVSNPLIRLRKTL